MNRKLRMGMVGGGKDAFIGAIHRIAANMDGLIEVSAVHLVSIPKLQTIRRNVISFTRPNLSDI